MAEKAGTMDGMGLKITGNFLRFRNKTISKEIISGIRTQNVKRDNSERNTI